MRKQNLKKLTVLACSVLMTGTIISSFATDQTLNPADGAAEQAESVDVKFNQSASYSVTIPKQITLGETKSIRYSVKVEGDIASNQRVYVRPVNQTDNAEIGFYMKDIASTGTSIKEDILATVNHAKTEWDFTDITNAYQEDNNSITADNLTAGNWQGSLFFTISLKQVVEDDKDNPKMSFLSEDNAVADMSAFSVRMGNGRQMRLSLADDVTAQDAATWESDNPSKIMADNGLIAPTNEAQAGDSANISVSVPTENQVLSTSFQVTVEEASTYPLAPENAINNWNYTLDDTNNIVTLNYYTGNETDVIVYGSYPVNGRTYKTQIASNPYPANATPYMFNGAAKTNCQDIKSIQFSDAIDTSNVTNMAWMFFLCKSLTSLDVSSFDTSNVMYMGCMFERCFNLKSLNVSSFDTSKVTGMAFMFYYCQSLTSLDLSSFDTRKVENMYRMFGNCTSLKTIYVTSGKWSTSQANTGYMFENCDTSPITYK